MVEGVAPTSRAATRAASSRLVEPFPSSASGKLHMPPSSPSAGRRTNSARPSPSTTTAVAYSTLAGALRSFGAGRSSWVPAARARHHSPRGQSPQAGADGVHTVAPSSMRAWFQSPGASGSTSPAAVSLSQAAPGSATSKSLLSTRRTFPSTAGTGRPKAMLAMAPAVYSPTPGSALSPS